MSKSKIKLSIATLLIALIALAGPVSAVEAATPAFRGLVYAYNDEYIETTPMQYVQFRNASAVELKALVRQDAGLGALKPLQALADNRGYVFTVLKYVQKGKSYSNLTAADQVTSILMRNASTVQVLNQLPVLISKPATVSDISFGGVPQTIGTNNTITVAVDPTTAYTTASVTLSRDARVTVQNATRPTGKTALFNAGIINDAAAINAFTSAQTGATGQALIAEGETTITVIAVDGEGNNIGQPTVYTLTFVAQ
jgi:hypothetical protein